MPVRLAPFFLFALVGCSHEPEFGDLYESRFLPHLNGQPIMCRVLRADNAIGLVALDCAGYGELSVTTVELEKQYEYVR